MKNNPKTIDLLRLDNSGSVKPDPEQELKRLQIKAFTDFITKARKSTNKFNDPAYFSRIIGDAKILEIDTLPFYKGMPRTTKGLALHRNCGGDYPEVIRQFEALFSFMGYLNQFPIIYDRNWYIIDGYQRTLAAIKLGHLDVPFIRYDIDLADPYDDDADDEEERQLYRDRTKGPASPKAA